MTHIPNIPIRQGITILGPDEVRDDAYFDNDAIIIMPDDRIFQRKGFGWTISEKIGVGVINPRAIAKLKIITDDSD